MSATKSFNVGKLKVHLVPVNSRRVCYCLFYEPLSPQWVARTARYFDVSMVMITGMDWDDDLTPWPAPGAPAGTAPFKGMADNLLSVLLKDVLPKAELLLGMDSGSQRSVMGISLSGLFALWSWVKTPVFTSVASVSGSFWYPGFVEWMMEEKISPRGVAYLSLGDKEPFTTVPAFKSVGPDTAAVEQILRRAGQRTVFQWNPGNHYAAPETRLVKALSVLYPVPSKASARAGDAKDAAKTVANNI